MGYKLVCRAKDGRHVVENDQGYRFCRTPDREWGLAVAAYQKAMTEDPYNDLLDRVGKRAHKNGTWALYDRAKRAVLARQTPAPMPWGHVIFAGIK